MVSPYENGERTVRRVVNLPSQEEESRRRPHRDLGSWRAQRQDAAEMLCIDSYLPFWDFLVATMTELPELESDPWKEPEMSNAMPEDGRLRQISLIMPAFNEADGIQDAVVEAHAALVGLGYEFEIVVVDDGSSDSTAALTSEVAALRPSVRLIRHQANRGYGAALRTGFEAARYELVAFTDADSQFYLEDLDCLVPLTDYYPIAAGYRVGRQDSWRRRFFSWGYNKLVRLLLNTGLRDCDCALKVFRREVLPFILPETQGFFANAEMMSKARRLGLETVEVGVRHRPRRHGCSKVTLADIPRTLAKLLPYWWSRILWSRRPPVLRAVLLAPFSRPTARPANAPIRSEDTLRTDLLAQRASEGGVSK
jgi:hypothetical protein